MGLASNEKSSKNWTTEQLARIENQLKKKADKINIEIKEQNIGLLRFVDDIALYGAIKIKL